MKDRLRIERFTGGEDLRPNWSQLGEDFHRQRDEGTILSSKSNSKTNSKTNPSLRNNLKNDLDLGLNLESRENEQEGEKEQEIWNTKSKSKLKSESESKSESKSKQENNKENNKESNKERRIKAGNQYNDGKFIFSWKSETNSWIIGDTSRSGYNANAIYDGDYRNCPEEIIIKGRFNPRENGGNNVVNNEAKEGPVEEVGVNAFNTCGYDSETKKVVVPKEVKIIREYGFCNMYSVTDFTIEIGSQLESIETAGLHCIGYNEDRTDSNSFSPDLKNLILPHTLKSVSVDGIRLCNRFTRIIYCGNHNLNINSSTLSNKGTYTKVYITPEYKAKNGNSIFGRAATGVLSEDEIKISCSGMLPQPTLAPSQPLFNSRCSQLQFSLSPLWSLVCALLPFNLNLPSPPSLSLSHSPPSLLSSHSNSHSHSHSKSNSCLSFLTKVPHLSFS